MSDVSQGDGWWVASDGKWYAPDLHPEYRSAPPSEPPVAQGAASGSSADEPSSERPADAHATARKCINGHEMPESSAYCSVCGSGRSEVQQDFSATQSDTRTGVAHKIGAFYGREGRLTPKVRIILTAVIVVFVIGGIGMAASGGSSSSGSSSGNSTVSAPAQSPIEVCYSTLEGWEVYFQTSSDGGSLITEEFGLNSGIPNMIFSAIGPAQVAANENGMQAGQLSLAHTTVANCKILLGKGDDPTTWPTAPTSPGGSPGNVGNPGYSANSGSGATGNS